VTISALVTLSVVLGGDPSESWMASADGLVTGQIEIVGSLIRDPSKSQISVPDKADDLNHDARALEAGETSCANPPMI
jgi:hypothetical protein